MDAWPLTGVERSLVIDHLDALPEDAWARPSLCNGWTVKDVVAHMTATSLMTPGRFFGKLASSGFSFNRMVSKEIADLNSTKTPAQLVTLFKGHALTRQGPPGPALAMTGEAIIHGSDIFRALGGYLPHDTAHVVAVADFYKKSNLIVGTKRRIAGVLLKATDADWQHGDGPEVTGQILPLLMVMTGRKAALDDVAGEGVEVLRHR